MKLCNSGAQGRPLCHQTSRLLLTPPLNVCECKHDLYRQRSCLERHFCLPVPHRRRRRRRGACCLHGRRSHLADQPCSNKQLVIIDCGEKIQPPLEKNNDSKTPQTTLFISAPVWWSSRLQCCIPGKKSTNIDANEVLDCSGHVLGEKT